MTDYAKLIEELELGCSLDGSSEEGWCSIRIETLHKVVDSLRDLTAEVERLGANDDQKPWINTKDKLPPYDFSVLCFCRIYGRYVGSYNRIAGDIDAGFWSNQKESGILPPVAWRPLPYPPIADKPESDQ